MRLVFIVFVIAVTMAGACLAQFELYGGLSQGVRAASPVYDIGEPISLQFDVRNTSSSTMFINFRTGKQFDIWITQGDGELFRASKGMVYAQSPSSVFLRPGETRTFRAQWNQREMNTTKQVGPGVYLIYAQLAVSGKNAPAVTTGKVQIGMASAALVPITVKEAITSATRFLGRRVMLTAEYRGAAPVSNDPNTSAGPPVTPSDWAICDATGCMYITGPVTFDAAKEIGTNVTVVGRIARTEQGQVYLMLLSATTSRGSARPR